MREKLAIKTKPPRIEQIRGGHIFKMALYLMNSVTSAPRCADVEQDGFIFTLRLFERGRLKLAPMNFIRAIGTGRKVEGG